MSAVLEIVRKLGFGAAFGAGIGAWIFLLFPNTVAGTHDFKIAAEAGAFLGAGLCQLINGYLILGIFKPISCKIKYYSKLMDLWAVRRSTSKSFRDDMVKQIVK